MERAADEAFPDLALIIPTLNEAEGIDQVLRELDEVLGSKVNVEYIVIDGGSVDKTPEIAKKRGATVMLQEGDGGKGQAIGEALQRIDPRTRYVALMDADYTYPAEYIPKMIELLEQNRQVGMVTGDRFVKRFEVESAIHDAFYLGNRLLAFSEYILNGVKLRDPLTGLRVVRRRVLSAWRPRSKGFDIEVELNCRVYRSGLDTVEIPIHYRKRLGEKKLKLRHGLAIFKRLIIEVLHEKLLS